MYSRRTIVQNSSGLHARPASDFINCAKRFSSKIAIRNIEDMKEANAKSILMILSLCLKKGAHVEICAKGEDEVEAVDTLVELIDSKFGETEQE